MLTAFCLPPAEEVPGLWNLGKSYLALDTDSRVVRLDSFAKFLAPGFRLGWVTAHPTFIDKLTWHMHGTALGPCSTTQACPSCIQPWHSVHATVLQARLRQGLLLLSVTPWHSLASAQHVTHSVECSLSLNLKLSSGMKQALMLSLQGRIHLSDPV